MPPTGSPPRRRAAPPATAVAAALVLLGGCAHTEAPERPPPRPTTPPQAPAITPWAAKPDTRAAAELAALEARAAELIGAVNDLSEGDERAAQLLVDAAAAYEEAGRFGHAIRVLEYLRRIHPTRAEAVHARTRIRALYLSILSDRDAASTLHARACGATIIDPPPEASAPALLDVVACLEDDRLLFVVALRYRRLAAARGAGADNDAQIEALEERRAEVEASLYRRAAADPRR
ncbi:MAG: hypothetical protein KC486_07410 [Myxococcales bacterium]|nr:hypothetical protein [Myxococcales bacterium]